MLSSTKGRTEPSADRRRLLVEKVLGSTKLACLFIFLTMVTIYLLTAQFENSQIDDTTAAMWPAWNFVHHGSFMLDHTQGLARHNDWIFVTHGHRISNRMMGVVILGVPMCALLSWTHLSVTDLNAANAAVLSALTITVLGATLRRVAPSRTAMAATFVIGFGTSIWTVAGSQTWPQTGDALWLALMLYFVSRRSPRWLWAAGFILVPALLTRPHLACVSLVLGVGLAWRGRSLRPLFAFGIPPIVSGVILAFWNHWYLGTWNLLGAYASHAGVLLSGQGKTTYVGDGVVPYWEGALATFFSPRQGLFVFTPVAALAVLWMIRARRHIPFWAVLAVAAGCLYEVIQLRVDVYTGGAGFYGGRLIIELMVLASPAAVAAYLPWSAGHPWRRITTTALCAASMATFTIGARLALLLVSDPLDKAWVRYFPVTVVSRSGEKGFIEVGCTLLVASGFVILRSAQILQPQAIVIAPRDPGDDEPSDKAKLRQTAPQPAS